MQRDVGAGAMNARKAFEKEVIFAEKFIRSRRKDSCKRLYRHR
jgi:hypothetical protein